MVGWRKSREGLGAEAVGGRNRDQRSSGLGREAQEENEPPAARAVECSGATSPLWAPVSPAVVLPALSSPGFCVSRQFLSLDAATDAFARPPGLLLRCFLFPPSLPSAPLSIYCPPGFRLYPD